jgi:thiamine-monophosphate kinase
MSTLPRSREHALIAAIRERAGWSGRALRLGIGDDCAILRPRPGHEIVVTTDLSIENVHFRRHWHPPESVGHRTLARGLSDLAAVGAKPLAAFLSLAIPAELTRARRGKSWFDRFLDGFFALADRFEVPLAGGDTAQSPIKGMACADVILLGSVRQGRALLRSTARAGDAIYVTGSLGGAEAELAALKCNPRRFTRARGGEQDHPHLYPEPRLAAAVVLARRGLATAAIDVSDGLSIDLGHLCEESHLAAELDAEAIPIHSLALNETMPKRAPAFPGEVPGLELALHGGEDYELLFTASERSRLPHRLAGVGVHRIGRMIRHVPGQPLLSLIDATGNRAGLEPAGYQHFQPVPRGKSRKR